MKTIERKVQKLDASGKKLGRLASEIAIMLMGKHRADYVPHHDMGDIVEVSQVDQIDFNAKKAAAKNYYHYSGYPGGLKEINMKDLLDDGKADEVLHRAVFQMLPDNKLRKNRIKRLIIK